MTVCSTCGARYTVDTFALVAPGDLRHVSCWQADVDGGRAVALTEPEDER